MIADYVGYSQDELMKITMDRDCTSQYVQSFLQTWEMPYCGTKTLAILKKLASCAGVPLCPSICPG